MRYKTSHTHQAHTISHVDGTDGFFVYRMGCWVNVYRSLVAAKRYVSKKIKVNYETIAWQIVKEEVR